MFGTRKDSVALAESSRYGFDDPVSQVSAGGLALMHDHGAKVRSHKKRGFTGGNSGHGSGIPPHPDRFLSRYLAGEIQDLLQPPGRH